jgi:transposase-like protein
MVMTKMKCPRCGSDVVFPASNPRYRHKCHICGLKWRDEKNGGAHGDAKAGN